MKYDIRHGWLSPALIALGILALQGASAHAQPGGMLPKQLTMAEVEAAETPAGGAPLPQAHIILVTSNNQGGGGGDDGGDSQRQGANECFEFNCYYNRPKPFGKIVTTIPPYKPPRKPRIRTHQGEPRYRIKGNRCCHRHAVRKTVYTARGAVTGYVYGKWHCHSKRRFYRHCVSATQKYLGH